MPVDIRLTTFPAVIGFRSLVGICSSNYPLSFGNYFSISKGPRIINMWAENLEEWLCRTNQKDIQCRVFTWKDFSLGLVEDDRIPQDWLNKDPCITGSGWGSAELCIEVHKYLGKPLGNSLCGCEKLEDFPHIYVSYQRDDSGCLETFRCYRCGRRWA